ncbi:phosphatase PAP2 family protein [Thermonema rossianum]|uniref:phosphatase PAP2 family protein n=1 Tax=Thermonema rossianum TaxID=55505 RepID=UPI00056F31EE|nr:phosphatase PAP2 family protein [Thermonema rossianum]
MNTFLQPIEQWDYDFILWVHRHHRPWADGVMTAVSETWTWLPLYALLLWGLWKQHRATAQLLWHLVAVALVVLLADQLTSAVMKPFFERLRPCHNPLLQPYLLLPDGCGGRFGFASSHAANTFGVAAFFVLLWRKQSKWVHGLWLWASVVAFSRVYLGKHYLSDVVVGGLVGGLAAFVVYYLLFVFLKKKDAGHAS